MRSLSVLNNCAATHSGPTVFPFSPQAQTAAYHIFYHFLRRSRRKNTIDSFCLDINSGFRMHLTSYSFCHYSSRYASLDLSKAILRLSKQAMEFSDQISVIMDLNP
ncbi:hypothetical protein SLE2022_329060 [Rubroshorea leprosula]